jgi:hypothetical protein
MGAAYAQLSITERRRIERWRHARVPVDEMARVLKRCRSTIFRELKRNHFSQHAVRICRTTSVYCDMNQSKLIIISHCENSGIFIDGTLECFYCSPTLGRRVACLMQILFMLSFPQPNTVT